MKPKQLKQTMLDKAVSWISPKRGVERLRNRAILQTVSGGYSGASKSRRTMSGWTTRSTDADSATLTDLPTLRDRSRDLIRNNALACGAVNTKVTNIVGTGLRLNSRIDSDYLGLNEEQANEWQSNTEREFRIWSESMDCDATRTQTFEGLQQLAFRSVFEGGDCFALMPFIDRGGPYSLSVQLMESDMVANPNGKRDTQELSGGIEKDQYGAPKIYHFLQQHPGSSIKSNFDTIPISAFGEKTGRRNVLHLYNRQRIGQTRGIPELAPVIECFRQLGNYTDAELEAAAISAAFTVFIKAESGGLGQMMPTTETGGSSSDDDYKMASGAMIELNPNEDVEFANPTRPNSQFDPFVMSIYRQMGVALELPVELFIMHFTASYSASRAAILQAFKFFKVRRQWLISSFCYPIYYEWMTEAILNGRILAPGFMQDAGIRKAYLGCEWIGPSMGQIDPLKEAQANEIFEDRGWKTGAEITTELTGGDWDQKHKERIRENKLRKDSGLQSKKDEQAIAVGKVDENDEEEIEE